MKALALIIVLAISLCGVAMAADTLLMCPWDNDNPAELPITNFEGTTAGHAIGTVIIGASASGVNSESGNYNAFSYDTNTLANGETDYAYQIHGNVQGISTSINTEKAVVNTGLMGDSEDYGYSVVNSPVDENGTVQLANAACYMGRLGYLSMNSQAAIATQLSLNTGLAAAPVSTNYQFGITGANEGNLASGTTVLSYGYSSRDFSGVGKQGGMQVWSGKYEFAHTNRVTITNPTA
jgi:hypothetical protein